MYDTKSYYEEFANAWVDDAYSKKTNTTTIGYQRIQTILKVLSKYTPNIELSILDLGCGGGHLGLTLAKEGHQVTGVDQSSAMLKLAAEQAQKQSLENKIDFKKMSIEQVENNLEGKFDVITCMGVMYYLPSDDTVFAIARKLLKPNGLLIVSCRNKLFNIFNNSFMLQKTIENGEVENLTQEISNLSKEISLEAYAQFTNNIKEMVQTELPVNIEQTDEWQNEFISHGKKILGRSHTPQELNQKAVEFKAILLQLYGIQPHFMLASSSDKQIATLNRRFAECLNAFQEFPISLTWCSHFIAALKF